MLSPVAPPWSDNVDIVESLRLIVTKRKNMQNNFKLWAADLCTRVSSDGVFGTRLAMAEEDLQRCLGGGESLPFLDLA